MPPNIDSARHHVRAVFEFWMIVFASLRCAGDFFALRAYADPLAAWCGWGLLGLLVGWPRCGWLALGGGRSGGRVGLVGRLLALVLACGLFCTPLALQEGTVPFCYPAHLFLLLNVLWHD